jgi:hypothetical protein
MPHAIPAPTWSSWAFRLSSRRGLRPLMHKARRQKKGGNEKADHPNHIGLGISLITTKEIIPIIRE